MKHHLFSGIAIFSLLSPLPAFACDLCAVHNLLAIDEGEVDSWSLGISEQLSSYGTVQQSDEEIENPSEQYLRSSVTQFTLGYKAFHRLGFQITAPIIYRRYRTVEEGEKDDGSVGGLGDISLLARVPAYRHESADSTLSLTLFGGVKLPTGDANRLGGHEHTADVVVEEPSHDDMHDSHSDSGTDATGIMEPETDMGDAHDSDGHVHEDGDHAAMHEGHVHEDVEASAVHGHDLALGSGSFDLVTGVSGMARYKRAFVSGNMQYALRSEGSYNYRYGDDFQWSFGSGVYLDLSDEQVVMLRAAFSGEAKGRDVQDGNKENDTGIITYFVGPEAAIAISSKLRLEAGLDLPLEIKNTGTQAVADYRFRGAVSYRF